MQILIPAIVAAIVSALVTVIIEVVAKPHLEARRERIVDEYRVRRELAALCRRIALGLEEGALPHDPRDPAWTDTLREYRELAGRMHPYPRHCGLALALHLYRHLAQGSILSPDTTDGVVDALNLLAQALNEPAHHARRSRQGTEAASSLIARAGLVTWLGPGSYVDPHHQTQLRSDMAAYLGGTAGHPEAREDDVDP